MPQLARLAAPLAALLLLAAFSPDAAAATKKKRPPRTVADTPKASVVESPPEAPDVRDLTGEAPTAETTVERTGTTERPPVAEPRDEDVTASSEPARTDVTASSEPAASQAVTPEPAPRAVPPPPPAAAPTTAAAPEPTKERADLDVARDMQTPSPGGAGRPRALLVDTPDFTLALRGFAQFQVAPLVGKDALLSNGDAADFAGFRARRVLFGVEGRAAGGLSYGLWIDPTDTVPLSQARLAWSPLPEFAVEFGVVRVPFSKNGIQSSAELVFQERPLAVDKLVPDRQPGVALYGAVFGGILSYRAGLFNGANPARAALGNDHPGYLAAARVAIDPFGPLRPGQADLTKGDLKIELAANGYVDDNAAFSATAAGVDLSAQFLGFSLVGEWLWDQRLPKQAPVVGPSLPGSVIRTGLIGQLSYVIWPRGLELAARAESVDDNTGLQDAGDSTNYALGLHWNVADLDLRVNLDWYLRLESFGPVLDNDVMVVSTQGRF